MTLAAGFLFVLIGGVLQGSFILPMTLTKKWSWEHTWGIFSLLGMLTFNWMIGLLVIPNIISVYRTVPPQQIIILIVFGAAWGIGAILFGIGMDRLGMALGYAIIMGLTSTFGALIPLVIFFPGTLCTRKGLTLLIGTVIAIGGIVLCSMAGARKRPLLGSPVHAESGDFAVGLLIAILAGIFCCLPNVGMAFGTNVILAAQAQGASKTFSSSSVWVLFFTVGFIVNFGYCFFLMVRRKKVKEYFGPNAARNLGLSALMAIMWIGSFYLYGMGTAKLGRWGVVVGWPLFISSAILVGNLWGIWRGEWKDASPSAGLMLKEGLLVLLIAVITIGISNSL